MTKSPLKKTRKPYVLKMGVESRVVGFYPTCEAALAEGRSVNKNRLRSGGPKCVENITVVYDQAGEQWCIAHQESRQAALDKAIRGDGS